MMGRRKCKIEQHAHRILVQHWLTAIYEHCRYDSQTTGDNDDPMRYGW
jgi:hypothetical protein